LGRRRRQSAATSRLLLGIYYALLDNLAELYFDALDLNLEPAAPAFPWWRDGVVLLLPAWAGHGLLRDDVVVGCGCPPCYDYLAFSLDYCLGRATR
jgi:hypothetical protein